MTDADREYLGRLAALAADPARGSIALATPHEIELFRCLPLEQRVRISVWLGKDLPLWTGDCVRCDGPLQYANDSYGSETYTRLLRCSACGWRDEQPTNEPTMSALLSQARQQDKLAKRLAITDQAALPEMPELAIERIANITAQPDSTDARVRFAGSIARADLADSIRRACTQALPTHWDRRDGGFDQDGWYGPLVELLGDLKREIVEIQVAQGFVDHVVISARTFLDRADELFARAPVRSVELLDAASHLDAIRRSPYLPRLVGLGLEAPMFHSMPHLPRLRHFALRSRHELTIEELTELVHAPALATATCVHVRTPALDYSDDSDYISFYSLSDYGLAVQELARRSGRRWLDELLRPVLARTRR